jgi:hypothetical protein
MRLLFSSSSLSSSASHLRFLVRLAGGELGGGITAAVEVSVAVAMSSGARAVMVLEGHRCQQRRRFREFVAIVSIGNRQKSSRPGSRWCG